MRNLPNVRDLGQEALDYYASDPDPVKTYERNQLEYARLLLASRLDPTRAYETTLLEYETLRHDVVVKRLALLDGTIDLSFVDVVSGVC